jgi:hypothetical protein
MGRHASEEPGAWDIRSDAEAIRALRDWYANLPESAPPTAPVLCPRCGSTGAVSFGAQYSCNHCGRVWQAEPPLSPRERHTARRRLDERAHRPT